MKVGKMSNRKILRQVFVLCLCVAAGWFLKAKLSPQGMMAPAGAGGEPFVLVEEAQLRDVTPAKKFIGHVEAVNEVNIQPQVSGYLEKVLFEEGSKVKTGDILFVIEQQRYIATVDQRKAELDKAKASFTQLEKEYKRQKSLNQQKFASESKLDEAYSNMLQAQAAVKQAEANYELAKIDLEHTEIRSPINGYIGKAMITVGNYVSTSSGTMANIVQTDPVRIVFSVTDKEMLNLKEDYTARGGEIYSKIILPNGKEIKKPILSRFTDNSINTGTATISIYSEFENGDGMLIPGGYVDIMIGTGTAKNAVVISQAALSQDEHGTYVMTVNKDNIVEQKRVTLGDIIDNQQIVTSGLEAGEQVIIQGLQKVTDGKKVRTGSVDNAPETKGE